MKLDYLDAKGKRKEINLKSLREYGRTQAYNETLDKEFAEYHFGHKIRYKNKGTDKELEQFKKCESKAFTFLDPLLMAEYGRPDRKKIEGLEKKIKENEELEKYYERQLKLVETRHATDKESLELLLAKSEYNRWIKEYQNHKIGQIETEVEEEKAKKANPSDYFVGIKEIKISVDEQTKEFKRYFKESFDGKELNDEQVEKINIKEVFLKVHQLCELNKKPIYINADPTTEEGMTIISKAIFGLPQFID